MTHKGIELRIEIDGKPVIAADSALLHNLARFGGNGDKWTVIVGSNADPAALNAPGLRVLYRAVELMDAAELDAHAAECEADEDLTEDQDQDIQPPYRAPTPWDVAALANWKLDYDPVSNAISIHHMPCFERHRGITMLSYAMRIAFEHKCKRDEPKPGDPPAVADWLQATGRQEMCSDCGRSDGNHSSKHCQTGRQTGRPRVVAYGSAELAAAQAADCGQHIFPHKAHGWTSNGVLYRCDGNGRG